MFWQHIFWVAGRSDARVIGKSIESTPTLEVKDHKKNSPLELLIVNPY